MTAPTLSIAETERTAFRATLLATPDPFVAQAAYQGISTLEHLSSQVEHRRNLVMAHFTYTSQEAWEDLGMLITKASTMADTPAELAMIRSSWRAMEAYATTLSWANPGAEAQPV